MEIGEWQHKIVCVKDPSLLSNVNSWESGEFSDFEEEPKPQARATILAPSELRSGADSSVPSQLRSFIWPSELEAAPGQKWSGSETA